MLLLRLDLFMNVVSAFILSGLLSASAPALAANYYVDPAGSDRAAGTAPGAAWKTLARLARQALKPGDRVVLTSGASFTGPLTLGPSSSGTRANPVVITTSGAARATIAATRDGIAATDNAGYVITNLRVLALNPTSNQGIGVHFHSTVAAPGRYDGVSLRDIEVAGFLNGGVIFEADDFHGYQNVSLTNVSAHDDGDIGIKFAGRYVQANEGDLPYSHANVRVTNSTTYRNRVNPATGVNTGSGILLGQVSGGVVEYCTAYANGGRGVNSNGGPIGIWTYDSTHITIQHNKAWDNRTSNANDGGGFDLDGGVSNSIIQYNYSHGNDGAGYLLTQFATARPFRDNLVRWNVSENDGRNNGYASFLSFADAGTAIETTIFANNTAYMGQAMQPTSGVRFFDGAGTYKGVAFRNNILVVQRGVALLEMPVTAGIAFQGNLYWTYGGPITFRWGGKTYTSFADWRAATGQERVGGADVGLFADPLLSAPGQGGTIGDPRRFDRLNAYTLQRGSSAARAGLDLVKSFGEEVGPTDFYGRPVNSVSLPIGAATREPSK